MRERKRYRQSPFVGSVAPPGPSLLRIRPRVTFRVDMPRTPMMSEDEMTPRSGDAADERLRPPPSERFEGPSHMFDLDEVARELRAEDHPSRRGHRQMTLFQRDHITHVVFVFDEDGHLSEHSAPGLVTIHAHSGHIRVKASGTTHELGAGNVLVLAPGVPHSVEATEQSVMLLTVHVERHGR